MTEEERLLVDTVRAFVDREVEPAVRETEHANTYRAAWIDQMKRIGIYGLAIPEEFGGSPVSMPCYIEVAQELARGRWPSCSPPRRRWRSHSTRSGSTAATRSSAT